MEKPYDMTTKMLPKETKKKPSFHMSYNVSSRLKEEITLEWIFTWKSSGTTPCSQQEKLCHCIILLMAVFSQALNISLQDGDPTSLNKLFCFQPSYKNTKSKTVSLTATVFMDY